MKIQNKFKINIKIKMEIKMKMHRTEIKLIAL